MSREIKFKFWLPSIKRMTYGHSLKEIVGLFEQQEFTDEVVSLEFTGLKDRKGKEVYEGDRVKIRRWLIEGKDYMDYNCDIVWNGWCYGLCIAGKQVWGLSPITAKECEVIGNIYENPDLLTL